MRRLIKQGTLLHAQRDAYGLIQVIETQHSRCLYFNTPVEQSHFLIHAPFQLELDYQAKMTDLVLQFCQKKQPYRLLSLGVGGGLMNRYLYDILPNLSQTLVELRAIVLDTAYQYFNLPDAPQIIPVIDDAMHFVTQPTPPFDIILVDLYDEQGMPPDCTTDAFLTNLMFLQKRPGLVIFNLWKEDLEALNAIQTFCQRKQQQNPKITLENYLISSSGNIILAIQIKE